MPPRKSRNQKMPPLVNAVAILGGMLFAAGRDGQLKGWRLSDLVDAAGSGFTAKPHLSLGALAHRDQPVTSASLLARGGRLVMARARADSEAVVLERLTSPMLTSANSEVEIVSCEGPIMIAMPDSGMVPGIEEEDLSLRAWLLNGQTIIRGPLLGGHIGRLSATAVAPDGTIYTASEDGVRVLTKLARS